MNEQDMMRALGRMMRMTARKEAPSAEANDVIDIAPLLEMWKPGTMDKPATFARGDVRVCGDLPWWCVTGHTHHGEEGWQPGGASALWAQYHGRDAAHALPFAAEGHNPYMTGHWCTEEGTAFECLADNVVWPPSVQPDMWRQGG